ncbi:MAG: sensor histidine kinase, partial [Phycicoccus sp.]
SVRRPWVAGPDGVVVSLGPVGLGVGNSLTALCVSTALLVGMLFRLRFSVPLTLMQLASYVVATGRELGSMPSIEGYAFPVELATVAAAGAAIRRMALRQRRVEVAAAADRASAAAAQERLRLARELHDTVAKSVQAVALTSAALPQWMRRDPARAARLAQNISIQAHQAVDTSRSLMASLRADEPGRPVHEVVQQMVDLWRSQRDTEIRSVLLPVPEPSAAGRQQLLWALREALDNAGAHAPGASVLVLLGPDDVPSVVPDGTSSRGGVLAVVQDDGPGLASGREEWARAAGHFGRTGMRERLASVGGAVRVRSAPGVGARVEIRVPLDVPGPGSGGVGPARVVSGTG